jgi:uncharacterized membrane protein
MSSRCLSLCEGVAALKSLAGAGVVVLAALYPAVVYLSWRRGQLRLAGLFLLVALLMRLLASGSRGRMAMMGSALGGLFALAIVVTQSATLARFYPVLVSVVLLAGFGLSLLWPPAVVTRIAHAAGVRLDERGIAYTRNVTVVWCAFFIANGSVAWYTAVAASAETWALYNGLIAYLLAGALFVIEWLVRPKVARGGDVAG